MASAVQDRGDSPRAQARNGVLAWARAAGRGVRTATPYGIFAFLTASALAPVAVPSLGLSGEFAAALGQLGGMGTNYLTDVLTGAATRMRDDQQSPSPEEWRDTLADLLVPRLEASAGLRAEVGELLESVDAVGLALAEGTAELRIELADAVRELGGEFAVSARVLAEVQQQLAMLSADQRLLLELTRRSLLSIVQLRQELPPAAGAAPGPGRAPAGRTQRSRAELRTAEPGTTEPAAQPGATQPAEKEAGATQPGPTQPGPTQPGPTQPGRANQAARSRAARSARFPGWPASRPAMPSGSSGGRRWWPVCSAGWSNG